MNTRADAEAMLEAALRGDLAPHAPELLAALAAHPDLARKLDELRAIEQGLAQLGQEPAAIYQGALGDVTARDRDQVARIVHGRAAAPRRLPFLIVLAALLLVGAGIVWGVASWPSPPTGMLSGTGAVTARVDGQSIVVHIATQLPPNESYRLRLVSDPPRTVPEARTTEPSWTLPQPWMEALAACTTATLVVDIPGLGVVGTVRFEGRN